MVAAVKTLTELGSLMGQNAAAQEERLLSFLAVYQQANSGATPAYAVMASQLDLLEPGVRVLLSRLENKGKIHFVSRNPPRIMLIGKDTVLPHEPTAADMGLAKEGSAGRFLDAEGERMRLGRYIATTIHKTGSAPTLADMHSFVGFGTTAYVNRMAEILAERGIIQYGRGVRTALTERGQQIFGVKITERKERAMEQPKKDAAGRIIVMTNRKSYVKRVKDLCEVLAARVRAQGTAGYYTLLRDLAVDMGYSSSSGTVVGDIALEAVKQGYLKPKQPKTHGLFFTEKGVRKFLPEMVEEQREPETIPMETPIVAQVAQALPPKWEPRLSEAEQAHIEGLRQEIEPKIHAAATSQLAYVETSALVMELIERGYIVRKG